MLTDPASFSPYPYRESHLEVRHMDAKHLEFEDGSFDAVFSLSSIEHFGSWADIRRSAEEIGRVLRPGGAAFVVTECFLGRSLLSPRAVQELGSKVAWPIRIFTPSLLRSEIVDPSGLELVQPLETEPPETGGNMIELHGGGRITSTTGADYPHIAVRVQRFGLRTQTLDLGRAGDDQAVRHRRTPEPRRSPSTLFGAGSSTVPTRHGPAGRAAGARRHEEVADRPATRG